MVQPIEAMGDFTFTYDGEVYKQYAPERYVMIRDGKEIPITKESNKLMEALLGGEIIDDTLAKKTMDLEKMREGAKHLKPSKSGNAWAEALNRGVARKEMVRPIDTVERVTFTYDGETFKRLAPNKYVMVRDGKEIPITKESNKLMEALLGGEIIDDTLAKKTMDLEKMEEGIKHMPPLKNPGAWAEALNRGVAREEEDET